MNVLFFIHNLSGGGAERVMSVLANEFVEKGHSVTIAITENVPANVPVCVYHLDPRIRLVTLRSNQPKPTNSTLNKIVRHLMDIFVPYRMRYLAKKCNADFIISFITYYNIEILKAFKGTKYPVIVSEHTNVTRELRADLVHLRDKLYPNAAAVTVLTRRDYNLWRDKFSNVVYMPNPVTPSSVDNTILRRNVVFSAGRVCNWDIKGYDNLIRAWGRICNIHPEWNLEIAGQYDEKSIGYLNEIIQETKAKNVHFLGFRNDVAHLMASSEVYCLSSRVEGLPMSLLEAMNAGCCCVSFDCTAGPSEIIEDGVTGLLVKDQDVDDLSDKLDKVMSDGELRRSLSQRAVNSMSRFSVSVIYQEWMKLIYSIQ